ncbi:MAG TPA: glycine/betaine ABC transporter [Bacilli bacterium]|nr:glycine/betaine ABC transporter [Bacilli bacterium]
MKKLFTLLTTVGLTLGLAACGGGDTNTSGKDETNGDTSANVESVGQSVNYKITGIDPGAGIMEATDAAIEQYGLENWEVTTGSGAAMTAALKKAYDNEEPIIVTGWTPHWKFSKFDLKYLEDPKGVYGGEENIHTIARLGLKEEHPNAYKLLDQFNWTVEDMGEVMVMIEDGISPEDAASQWLEENADKFAEWTEGVEEVDGDKLSLAYVAWDSEIASNYVLKQALEKMGFHVTLQQVEAGPMWSAVADGSADALIAAWLPVTHETYAKTFEGKYEDLGVNLAGTKIGLVVPSYMDINSIEDLKE